MKRTALFTVFCMFLFIMGGALHVDAVLEIHAIDAQEGEAMVLITPAGHTVLIDTGNVITGHNVYTFLKDHSITTIDHLIITHPHPDHMGGVFMVLPMLTVNQIYDNGQDLSAIKKDQALFRWYDELVRTNPHYRVLKRGDVITVDDVKISVLYPPEKHLFEGFNNNSLCLRIAYKGFTLMHAGDMQAAAEEKLLALKPDLNADVLKVGHHGFNDASSGIFLRAVSPQESVICIDKDNCNGYPSPEIITRLTNLGSVVRRTAFDGTISFKVADDGTFTTTTEKHSSRAA